MNILDDILKTKSVEVEFLKKQFKLSDYEKSDFFNEPSISLIKNIASSRDISIIAEIKKASPSKGTIRDDFNAREIANIFMNNKIEGISILTDQKYFYGDISYLEEIARTKTKPLLRKDFIIDEYQVYEAKAKGADVILLICEALEKNRIKDLTVTAGNIGLEVLLEFHSEEQISKIDFSINKLIGINNRNLNTFKTDISTTLELKRLLPRDILIISESGIESENSIKKLKDNGINAILVGEYLMKSINVEKSINELIKWCKIEN